MARKRRKTKRGRRGGAHSDPYGSRCRGEKGRFVHKVRCRVGD